MSVPDTLKAGLLGLVGGAASLPMDMVPIELVAGVLGTTTQKLVKLAAQDRFVPIVEIDRATRRVRVGDVLTWLDDVTISGNSKGPRTAKQIRVPRSERQAQGGSRYAQ